MKRPIIFLLACLFMASPTNAGMLPDYFIEKDGDWFLRLDVNESRVVLFTLKSKDSYFSRIAKEGVQPKIYLGTNVQNLTYNTVKGLKQIDSKSLSLSETQYSFKLTINSKDLIKALLVYRKNGSLPVLGFVTHETWTAGEFYRPEKPNRIANLLKDNWETFCEFIRENDRKVFQSPRIDKKCRPNSLQYQRKMIVLKTNSGKGSNAWDGLAPEQSPKEIRQVIKQLEKSLGPNDPEVAENLENLLKAYFSRGLYSKAEKTGRRHLKISKNIYGDKDPKVGTSLNNLAIIFEKLGFYEKAEEFLKRSIANKEFNLMPDPIGLINLASVYRHQGRNLDSILLLERAQKLSEKLYGPSHQLTVQVIHNLGVTLRAVGRLADAKSLLKRAFEIRQKELEPDNFHLGDSAGMLGKVLHKQGKFSEALPLLQQALEIHEKALGSHHPRIARGLANLADLHMDQGHYAAAELLLKRALEIDEKSFTPDHPSVATTLMRLAKLSNKRAQYAEAYAYSTRGVSILRNRFTNISRTANMGYLSEHLSNAGSFRLHADINLNHELVGDRQFYENEAFEVMQLGRFSSVGQTMQQIAVRFASADNKIAALVRRQQDLARQYEVANKRFVKSLAKKDSAAFSDIVQRLAKRRSSLESDLRFLDRKIMVEFPRYAELMRRDPLSIGEVQKLLGSQEALLTFTQSEDEKRLHGFVITSDDRHIFTTDVPSRRLENIIRSLRSGIDLFREQTRGRGLQDFSSEPGFQNLPQFDLEKAHELYVALLGSAHGALKGKTHLFVVPTGPLSSIPFHILVSRPNVESKGYRDAAWLMKRFAITRLPSVSSLRSIRSSGRISAAKFPFIGFGDPVLKGKKGTLQGFNIASLYRGGRVDPSAVRNLPSLPLTGLELKLIAAFLNAKEDSLYLGQRATEAMVKQVDLSQSKIVAFSTHGLVAGEITDLAEPALVFTPPKVANDTDDGLLTMSEITQLKLDADWVLLSACNTASGETLKAEGLSGLAKAFIYAGARSLLVSHWSVVSIAATLLTTGVLEELHHNPRIGQAEALRRSMLKLALNEDKLHYQHPGFWAPFSLVGEGTTSP